MTRHLVVRGAHGERELLLVGTIDVGRDPACTISASDPLLSRRHAEFVVDGGEVTVRDLSSRNGIRVNGDRCPRATLHPGDVVEIAGLHILYRDDAPAPVAPEPEDPDETIVVAPPTETAEEREAEPEPRPGPEREPESEEARTVLVAPAVDVPAAPQAGAAPKPAIETTTSTRTRAAHVARFSWSGRLMLYMVALAAGIIVVTAVPMTMWQQQTADEIGFSTARAFAQALGATAAADLETGANIGAAAEALMREPGVAGAVLMTPEGRILSPAARANQTVTGIPGIGAPADVLRPRQARVEDRVEVALPVRSGNQPRAAIAWITFLPAAVAGVGSAGLLLAPALLIAFGGALFVGLLLKRRTFGALQLLNEDIELAASGQIAEVADPLGAPPMMDVARTLNYLIAHVRQGSGSSATDTGRSPVGASRPAPDPVMRVEQPAGVDAPNEARIVTTPAFRVSEASPSCVHLLDVAPDAIMGKHIIDAIADRRVVDVLLRCLGTVGASGEHSATVEIPERNRRLAITVSRTGKDRPVTIIVKAPAAMEAV
jgi:hypothetical protein